MLSFFGAISLILSSCSVFFLQAKARAVYQKGCSQGYGGVSHVSFITYFSLVRVTFLTRNLHFFYLYWVFVVRFSSEWSARMQRSPWPCFFVSVVWPPRVVPSRYVTQRSLYGHPSGCIHQHNSENSILVKKMRVSHGYGCITIFICATGARKRLPNRVLTAAFDLLGVRVPVGKCLSQ